VLGNGAEFAFAQLGLGQIEQQSYTAPRLRGVHPELPDQFINDAHFRFPLADRVSADDLIRP
jgi:hypothetical protein